MTSFRCNLRERVLNYARAAGRCDGMVDVTDSKSVGLIPRVGSSPTTGTTSETVDR